MSGAINSSNNCGVEMNIDDIEIYDEELNNEEKISKIMNEIKDSKKRRYPSKNNESEPKILKESSISPNRADTSELMENSHRKVNLVKIQPVIFFLVDEKPNKLLIEKHLLENVQDIKIEDYKITAYTNLLIYTDSNEANEKLVCNN
jgi:hypothetical protein